MKEERFREILAEEFDSALLHQWASNLRTAPHSSVIIDSTTTQAIFRALRRVAEEVSGEPLAAARLRLKVIEECARVVDEFARPGPRAPADLGRDNIIWNQCADRIACCIRAVASSSEAAAQPENPNE